jgi:hypothetical protein
VHDVNDLGLRAARIDEALRRARRAGEQWEADLHHGRLPRDAPLPVEASVGPELQAEAEAVAVALCDAYIAAGPAERSALRQSVAALDDVLRLLHDLLSSAAERVVQTGDELWLKRGLAAAGLENRAIDERDTMVALNELWRAAERAGLDAEAAWPLSRT